MIFFLIFILLFNSFRIDFKNPFQKGNINDIYLGGTLNNVMNEYLNGVKSKYLDKTHEKTQANVLFHNLLYATDGILNKYFVLFTKFFDIICKNDIPKGFLDLERDQTKKFLYFTETFLKIMNLRYSKVFRSLFIFNIFYWIL